VLIGAIGAAVALVLFGAWIQPMVGGPVPTEPYPKEVRPFTTLYDPAVRPLEVVLNGGDGQAFAAIGRDPLLRHPEVFRRGPDEAAYRAQRPLIGWLAWLTVGGRPERVPEGLVVWTVLGIGVLVGAVAQALERAGRISWTALFLVAAPGVISNVRTLGPEALGCGFAVLGVTRWRSHRWQAVGWFVLAGFCRETLLLVPFVLALHGMVETRRLRPYLPLLVPPVLFGGWLLVVNLRTDGWPTQASAGRLAPGFQGLAEVAGRLDPDVVVVLVVLAVLALVVALRSRRSLAGSIVLVHVALASVLGEYVWYSWYDFGRVLLPLVVFGLIALAPRHSEPDGRPDPSEAGHVGADPVAVR
jgi:hypothetical protein